MINVSIVEELLYIKNDANTIFLKIKKPKFRNLGLFVLLLRLNVLLVPYRVEQRTCGIRCKQER